MKSTLSTVALATFLLASPSAAAQPVTECGQHLEFEDGELLGDLDCSTTADAAVHVHGATLRLNGHTLHGNVECEGAASTYSNCRIVGPGTVIGCVTGIARLTITDTTLTADADVCAAGNLAVSISAEKIFMTRSHVTGYDRCVDAGRVYTKGKVSVRESTLQDCADFAVMLDDGGNLKGPLALLMDTTVTDSGPVWATGSRLSLVRTAISGSRSVGAHVGGVLKAVDSSVTDSADAGVSGVVTQLRGTDVTGSCLAPEHPGCADVVSAQLPRLRDSSCDTSSCGFQCTQPWGVCSSD